MSLLKRFQVVVGIIRSPCRQIFITQRRNDSHLAGLWEFPGGKIEVNETPREALARELAEEVGVIVVDATFLDTIHYRYCDREIFIHVYLVEHWRGFPFGREGQNSRWVLQSALDSDDFPSANRAIIKQLQCFYKAP